jgi:hypothetical protein
MGLYIKCLNTNRVVPLCKVTLARKITAPNWTKMNNVKYKHVSQLKNWSNEINRNKKSLEFVENDCIGILNAINTRMFVANMWSAILREAMSELKDPWSQRRRRGRRDVRRRSWKYATTETGTVAAILAQREGEVNTTVKSEYQEGSGYSSSHQAITITQ